MSDDENVKWADIPRESRGLRACMVCKLMKTSKQFFESGCENCPMIDYRGNSNNVEQCTTANFSGSIALMSPKDSFIARFNGLSKLYYTSLLSLIHNIPSLLLTSW